MGMGMAGRFRLLSMVAVGAVATIAIQRPSPAAELTPIKFVMDWAWEGTQASWAVASESGCYAKNGLDVKTDRGFGSNDAIGKVVGGAYDIGVADFSTVANYNNTHPNAKLITVFIVSDRALTSAVGLKKAGILKPKDIDGKRIAGVQADASRTLFPAFAKANSIDLNSINWVNVAANLRQTTVVQGQADAAVGHLNTVVTGLHKLGVKDEDLTIMPFADFGVRLYGNSVIVKPDWAAAHADVMRSFVKCAVAGIKGTLRDPETAIATMQKVSSMVDRKSELDALEFSTTRAVYTDDVKKNGLSEVTAQRLDTGLTQIADAMGFPKPAPSDIWTPAYLPPQGERMIDK
jgi:NitT/TauT family transport system substrate-binding protein